MNKAFLPLLAFACAAVAAQLLLGFLGMQYCLTQLTMSLYYAIVVMGLCLLMGYAGQVSLGHGAFVALGGYTVAVLTTRNLAAFKDTAMVGWLQQLHLLVTRQDPYGSALLVFSPWAAFLTALAVTFLAACLIGYPALRLRGHYLAMATLGFGVIVHKLFLVTSFAGAADGITDVPQWKVVRGLTISGESSLRITNYYVACGLVLVTLVFLRNLIHSRVGRALQALHDRESAANAMGIDTAQYKLKVFVLSAMLAAVAGAFFTFYTGGIAPSQASVIKSVRYVALAAAGGMANLWGVVIVSVVLNYLSLRDVFGSYDDAVFGAILILIIALAPQGPFRAIKGWIERFKRNLEEGRA
jgi:branched-chain amino acid transport system permease protein